MYTLSTDEYTQELNIERSHENRVRPPTKHTLAHKDRQTALYFFASLKSSNNNHNVLRSACTSQHRKGDMFTFNIKVGNFSKSNIYATFRSYKSECDPSVSGG